jgi:hypothetical protein
MTEKCVPFKFTINGQEIEAFIPEKSWEQVLKSMDQNKTGYEKVDDVFWFVSDNDCILNSLDNELNEDDNDDAYETANYYSSPVVAENNARADRLMRQLRRFSVEHRDGARPVVRHYICLIDGMLQVSREHSFYYCGPWFDNLHAACLAIETFHDELMWYFTEYKDSL